MKYIGKRIILYLDILGFSNFVIKGDSTKEKIDLFMNFMVGIKELFPDKAGYTSAVTFSDTIIISVVDDEIALEWLVRIADRIQCWIFINLGMLSRGVIHSGELIHKDSFIFGAGLIEAYNMEKNLTYPAIYFSKECVKEFIPQLPGHFLEEESGAWVEEMVNLLDEGYFDHDCHGIFISHRDIFLECNKEKTLEIINGGLGSSECEQQKSKWRWLSKRFDLSFIN